MKNVEEKPSLTEAFTYEEDGNRDTLVDYTRTLLRKTRRYGVDTALGVVQRLDRDTSGLMMFTRSAHAKRMLAEQFREHTIERVYHAIVHGSVAATKWTRFCCLIVATRCAVRTDTS